MDVSTIEVLNDRIHRVLKHREELHSPSFRGAAIIVSWEDDLSPERDEAFGRLSRVLHKEYHYVLDTLRLAGPADSQLQNKACALLNQAVASQKPALIYYYGFAGPIKGGVDWISRASSNSVAWAGLLSLLQQSHADVLVFLDRQNTDSPVLVPRGNSGSSGDDLPSLTMELPLDQVRGRLEIIDSSDVAFADGCSFMSHVSAALQQRRAKEVTTDDLKRHLRRQTKSGSINYTNLSSQGQGRDIELVRVLGPKDVANFEFDLVIARSKGESDISEKIRKWLASSPGVARDIRLSIHEDAGFELVKDERPSNLLTLSVSSEKTTQAMTDLTEWIKKAPNGLRISPPTVESSKTEVPPTRGTKSPGVAGDSRVANNLSIWVEERNKAAELTATLLTRQGDYRRVVVLPVRWEEQMDDWDAAEEIGRLRSVFAEFFPDYQIKADLVLPSNDSAQGDLEAHIGAHTQHGSAGALGSRDLAIVVYNGHGGDGFLHEGDMILTPEGGREYSSVNWTTVARMLDTAACDVLQVIDSCFAATGTKAEKRRVDDRAMVDSIHRGTGRAEYAGKNETLGSSSRDVKAHICEFASMPLFADELKRLAEPGLPFTVEKWWYRIDSAVAERNLAAVSSASAGGGRRRRTESTYVSPFRKLHPEESLGASIVLKPKKNPERTSGTRGGGRAAEGYVYAKIRVVEGQETEVVYLTEEQAKETVR